jgi:hypothetical protein
MYKKSAFKQSSSSNQQNSTVKSKPPVKKSTKKPTPMPRVPNEIYMLILKNSNVKELASLRLVSHLIKDLAEILLSSRLAIIIKDQTNTFDEASTTYTKMHAQLNPQLLHYKTFLQNLSANEIMECTWYSSPPAELATVCACLCILKQGDKPSSRAALADPRVEKHSWSWSDCKKTMGRYDFKNWFMSLNESVRNVSFENIRKVERIIQQDQSITYERLREVSTAGYKLLIVVAAVLQYVSVAKDLNEKRVHVTAKMALNNSTTFLKYVEGKGEEVEKETQKTVKAIDSKLPENVRQGIRPRTGRINL